MYWGCYNTQLQRTMLIQSGSSVTSTAEQMESNWTILKQQVQLSETYRLMNKLPAVDWTTWQTSLCNWVGADFQSWAIGYPEQGLTYIQLLLSFLFSKRSLIAFI